MVALKQELQPDIMHAVFEIGQAILEHELVKPYQKVDLLAHLLAK